MPVELFVPKFEREERNKRFQALDAISELAPKDDRLSGSFGYESTTLAGTIKSRSEKGDGVCRNLDQVLFGSDVASVGVYFAEEADGSVLSLMALGPDTQRISTVNFKFARNNRFVSAKYDSEVGDGNFDWTWPSFSTDVLVLLEEDLHKGRELWAEKLRLRADDYYQRIDTCEPEAVGEIKALIKRMDDMSNYYEGSELFVFGQPPSTVDGRLKIDLTASFPNGWRYFQMLDTSYEFTDVKGRLWSGEDGGHRYVYNLAFGDFDIALHEVHRFIGIPSKIALDLVENDFRKNMSGGETGLFAKGKITNDRRVEGVLLAANPVVSYPIFRD